MHKLEKAKVWRAIYLGKDQSPEGSDKQSSKFYDSSATVKSDSVKITASSAPVQVATTAQYGENKSKKKAQKKAKKEVSESKVSASPASVFHICLCIVHGACVKL